MAASKSKLKFQVGDLVIDNSTGIIGIVNEYLGQGFYSLRDTRSFFFNSDGRFFKSLEVSPTEIDLSYFGINKQINGYVQVSRYLYKAGPEATTMYNTVVREDEEPLYYWNGYSDLISLKEPKTYVRYRGGGSPFMYVASIPWTEDSWLIAGDLRGGRIVSVQRHHVAPHTFYSIGFNSGQLYKESQITYIKDWEKEFAPFVIEGRVI